ncbi:alpha-amylase, partial [Oxalobacteraceae bacterium OM1]
IDVGEDPVIRRLSAEQSNSSLVMEEKMVLKVIRRLLAGVHPEAEMGRYLTEQGYANAPRLLGEVTRFAVDGTRRTMILLQEYIDNQGDAWQWMLDTLARWVQQSTVAPSAPTETDAELADPEEDVAKIAARLGTRLGELHAVLARPTDLPEFSPAPARQDDVAQWAAGARRQLQAAFDVLRGKREWSNEAEAKRVATLMEREGRILQLVDDLAAAGLGTLRTRIHGDFHLGQVLVAHGDVYLVDFEGEPVKPLEQRREKSSPLRDVAGLLRSFDYAAAFAVRAAPAGLNEEAELRRQQIVRDFVPMCRTAFLDAYREAAYAGPLRIDPDAEQALLQLFVLEKAAYEVCYEAANRPSWIPVPVNGLVRIVDQLLT